jgi:phosphomannomutase
LIRFGTSGWRGVVGEDFTWARAVLAVEAIADWLDETTSRARVVVAHDRRFLGPELADLACRALRARGHRPIRSAGAVATPVAVHALRARGAAAALVFTASHNPPSYQGLKLFDASGGSAPEAVTRRIEAHAARRAGAGLRGGPDSGGHPARVRGVALVEPYLRALVSQLDARAIRRAAPLVHFDALHGCGAGLVDVALARLGARVVLHRGEADLRFGGGPPDPVPERLAALARAVRGARGLTLGVATDGDADRYCVLDETGRALSETQALAMLVDHLGRSGRLGSGLALSVATGSLVEEVARAHGARVTRHRIGFKHLTSALARGEADVAGDESGGFALRAFGRDKDGVAAACLFTELVCFDHVPLAARLRALEARFGRRDCGRLALSCAEAPERHARGLAALAAAPPARVDGVLVRHAEVADGVRLVLDDGFVLIRRSGTEPVVRVYAEAPSRGRLSRRLAAGAALLRRAGA